MRLSLDTHVFLWAVMDDPRLPDELRDAIMAPDIPIFVSAACIWEATIKIGISRLDADPDALVQAIDASGFHGLPVAAAHAAAVHRLEPIHRDPFDRLLVAQAVTEHLTLATLDDTVRTYPGVRLLPPV